MDRDPELIRQRMKSPRAAAIAGIIFSTLFIWAHVLIRESVPPNPLGSAAQLVDQSKTVVRVLGVVPFGGIAFLWFIAVIRDRVGKMEDRFFATVFLGSGLVYLALMFAAAAIASGLMRVLGEMPGNILGSGAYAVGRATIYEVLNVYAIRMAAVFMISVSTILLRSQIAPRALAVLGYALALVLLLGIGTFEWAPLVFPFWALLISVLILIQRFHSDPHSERNAVLAAR
jgi:hypothetical protein